MKPKIVTVTDLFGHQHAELHGCEKYEQGALFANSHDLTPEEKKAAAEHKRYVADAALSESLDFDYVNNL